MEEIEGVDYGGSRWTCANCGQPSGMMGHSLGDGWSCVKPPMTVYPEIDRLRERAKRMEYSADKAIEAESKARTALAEAKKRLAEAESDAKHYEEQSRIARKELSEYEGLDNLAECDLARLLHPSCNTK